MNVKDLGEMPAFPGHTLDLCGMSFRQYLTAQALAGLAARQPPKSDGLWAEALAARAALAAEAVALADGVLEVLAKEDANEP